MGLLLDLRFLDEGGPSNQDLTGDAHATWVTPTGVMYSVVGLTAGPAVATWAVPGSYTFKGTRNFSGTAVTATWTVVAKDVTPGAVDLTTGPAHADWNVPAGSFSAGGSPQNLTAGPATASWSVPVPVLKRSIPAVGTSASWNVPGPPVIKRSIPAVAVSATWVVPAGTFAGGTPNATPPAAKTFGPWKMTQK